jgi:drug/metabolite transporter (DMT)-like permease
MSYLIIRERLSRLSWLGIALSFAGVLVVVSHGSLDVLRSLSFNRGDMLCFVSQVSWTVYSLMGLRVMQKLDPVATTGWAGFLGAWVTLAYGLATDDFHPVALSLKAAGSILVHYFVRRRAGHGRLEPGREGSRRQPGFHLFNI